MMDRWIEKLGRWMLPALVCLSLAVRWIQAARYFIKKDSPSYLDIAQAFSVGQLTAIHFNDFPPLYPLLIALVQPLTGDWVVAGKTVSVLLSGLAVIPLYWLARLYCKPRTACLVGLMYAVHPSLVEWSSNVLSDGSYLFFWTWALYFACQAVDRAAWRDYALCGLATAGAFLVRPEGLEVLPLLLLFGFCQRGRWPRRCAGLVGATALLALAISPYVWSLSQVAGKPMLTKKKPLAIFEKFRFAAARPLPDRDPVRHSVWSSWAEPLVLESSRLGRPKKLFQSKQTSGGEQLSFAKSSPSKRSRKWLGKLPKAFNPVILCLLLFGLLALRGELIGAQRLLLAAFCLHAAAGGYNLVKSGYLSSRHLLPIVVIGLIWAAAGLELLAVWLSARLSGGRWERVGQLGFLTAVVLVALSARTLRPVKGRDYLADIGRQLAARDAEGAGRLLCLDPRVAYYAGARWDQLDDRGGYRGVLHQLIKQQARYVVVSQDQLARLGPYIKLGWLVPTPLPVLSKLPRKVKIYVHEVTFFQPIAD